MTPEEVWSILETITDPEIPVVSLVEMGIVRAVEVEDNRVRVTLTPTFSGCPALHVMQSEIYERLHHAGINEIDIVLSNDPPWTSDWITSEARQKLKAFGLAPPPRLNGKQAYAAQVPVNCPYCDSSKTSLKNSFGSTLCRAIYYCNDCDQPFEQFKPL